MSNIAMALNGINSINCYPVDTQNCGDIGFMLDFYRDVVRLRIDIEVTSLHDISFQHHNDVVART